MLPYLEQSITITGLGSVAFENCVDGVIAMHTFLSRQFRKGALISWTPESFEGHQAITFTNRYFTPCKVGDGSQAVQMNPCWDPAPKHHLASLLRMTNKFKHLDDNRVHFLRQEDLDPNTE